MACQAQASDSKVSLSQTDVQLLSSAILTLSKKIDKFKVLPSQGKGKGKGKSPKRLRDDREQQHDPPAKKPAKDSSGYSSALESEETEDVQALMNKVAGDDGDIKQQEGISVAQKVNTVNAISNFVAGNIANHISSWRSITTDPSILEIVSGYFIELPFQSAVPHLYYIF